MPPNLWPESHGGHTVYRYRNPVSGKRTRLGSNRRAAIEAAKTLNSQLVPAETFGDWLQIYETEILPSRRHKRTGEPYSQTTIREYTRMLRQIRQSMGSRDAREIDRRQIADFLARYPKTASNRYRTLLLSVFKHAIARGWADESPVAGTIAHTEVVERRRLSLGDYEAIHEAAAPWFRRAMEGALLTLQPRQVLAGLRFDAESDGWLYVIRGKTRRQGRGHIRIEVTPNIADWLARCRDDLLSPYVIHREPVRRRREYMEQKAHWTAVTPEMLSREFQRLRDEVGVGSDLATGQRPTFHEIRALGADVYRDQGVPETVIQRLMGHASERMTQAYLDGHGVRWEDAKLGSFSP